VAQGQRKELDLDEVMARVGRLTQSLLEDGAKPSQVAFALTSVATDMGLQVAGDPLRVFPVLLDAIASAAKIRSKVESERRSLELTDQEPIDGATIH
jgi:hypothetical protein